jgi:hypothetical protein
MNQGVRAMEQTQGLAAILQVHTSTAIRMFAGVAGVVNLGSRKYRTLRVPRVIFDNFLAANSKQA